MELDWKAAAARFGFEGDFVPHGSGHINDTCVSCAAPRVILQRINTAVFQDVRAVMENICGVTEHLRRKIAARGGDAERGTLTVIKTLEGESFARLADGECFRAYRFVENSVSFDKAQNAAQLCALGAALGSFQRLLGDYPMDTLHETIAGFHDTSARVRQLEEAAARDKCGRRAAVGEELAFADTYKKYAAVITDAIAEGSVPLRVTHNDTKISNVLFDADTLAPLCVVDLDTVMPGSLLYDFGDALRSGAASAAEDERDETKIFFDLEKFEQFAKGFLSEMGEELTARETELLPLSVLVMTYECGVRFLTDYLNGDIYFKIHREKQNLDRARAHFVLARDIARKLSEMQTIVRWHIR